jgi:CobQ/CobB/MinD/ParA nucleotide binding domain
MGQNKLTIITGHYGSGKSEFAVNYAKFLRKVGLPVCLADLDIVNPYFRSRETRLSLEALGIQVVSDTLNSIKGLDMPYLSPAIKGHLLNKNQQMILDCGGDDVGIRVLKQFKSDIPTRDLDLFMVVNTFRPETSRVEQIIDMKNRLEQESGLKITHFIHNSNFLRQTTVQDLLAADAIMKEVSHLTQIPIKYVSGIKTLITQLPNEVAGERFIMELSLRSDWM